MKDRLMRFLDGDFDVMDNMPEAAAKCCLSP